MTTIHFPTAETLLHLPGPAGTLEVAVAPNNLINNSAQAVAIVCHPHPLHGGTMHNKVVTTCARALQQSGMSTLRFNYRGVGASTGHYGDFIGETADLLAVMDWVLQQIPGAQLWLAGFSFGAYIAAQGALQRPEYVRQLFSIAPAVGHTDFCSFTAVRCPWVVIQGEADEIVTPTAVYEWVDYMAQYTAIELIKLPASGHFFHGKLLELRDVLLTKIKV